MANHAQSRVEDIIQATTNGTPYNKRPLSRVEEDLLELKAAIDSGGGGGSGTKDYNQLENKPTLNGVTLQGNMVSKDVKVEADYDATYDPEEENVIIAPAQNN